MNSSRRPYAIRMKLISEMRWLHSGTIVKSRDRVFWKRGKPSTLASRFITGDTKEAWTDNLVKEWMIQRLPREARQFIRERTPTTSMEMAELTEKFFSAQDESYTARKGTTIQFDQGKEENPSRYHPYHKDYSRNYKDSRRQQSPSEEPKGADKVIDLTKEPQEVKPKSKNSQERKPNEPFKCFNCRRIGHMARDCCSKKPYKVNRVQSEDACQLCDGRGHTAKECPLRVNKIDLQSKGSRVPLATRRENSGRSQTDHTVRQWSPSISHSGRIFTQELLKNGMIRIKTITSPVTQHPATLVDVEIGDLKFIIRAAVLKKEDIAHDIIIGENIPNMTVHNLMDKTVRETPKQPTEEEAPAVVNQLQMVNIVTRAQAKKEKKTEEENRKATAESQADITNWDKVEAFPETEETEEEEHQPVASTPNNPTDRKGMAKAQQEDETLAELFEAAKQEDSSYKDSQGIVDETVHQPTRREN